MEAKDFERLQFWEYLNLMEVPLVVCAPFTPEILEICAKCHALSAQVLVGGDSSNGEAIDGVCLCRLHCSSDSCCRRAPRCKTDCKRRYFEPPR